ncbi:nuclear pore component-domain-containing protein [Gigaspora rosea]|uniref:Nuclear pore component-domain-containing protein n=1 Tax=Gigaspora rosea TaxID=44941 RepID=A0A397VRT1_9GLOM|nr:nuclear pore component-domain-containing protein [Gigaspora rosea]
MYSDFEEDPVDTPNWLDILPHHPIFHSNEVEQLEEDFKELKLYGNLQRKQSCLTASISKNLIVAVGSELRILNLMEFKYAWRQAIERDELGSNDLDYSEYLPDWMNKVKHVILDTPSINYNIRSITVNFKERGTLIAVAGDYEVAVVVMPKSYSGTICKYYHVVGSSPIAKVLWHPMSESGAHLAVLTEDMKLRMYNILEDVKEPEQEFNFSPIPQKEDISFSTESTKAASFCFGQGHEGWGAFVVYVVADNGDIYSMCPIVPNKCICPKFFLDQLACLISKKHSEVEKLIIEHKVKNCYNLLNQYQRQLEWMSAIYKQIGNNNSNKVVFSPPAISRQSIQLQGPYYIQPTPVELSAHVTDASDIICLGTQPVNVIVIAFNNGRIDICLEVDRVEALWKMDGASDIDNPTLILYECIDLGFKKVFVDPTSWRSERITNSMNNPSIVQDPFYADTFYVYHFAGVHGIVLKGWLDDLSETIKDVENEIAIESFLEKARKSNVSWIAGTLPGDPDPFIGLSIMSDVQLSYAVLMLSSTLQLIYHELSIRRVEDIDDLYQYRFENDSRKNIRYNPDLPHFPESLTKYLNYQGLTRQPKLVVPRAQQKIGGAGYEVDNTEFLQSIMDTIQQEIFEMKEAVKALCSRADDQSVEFRRQIKSIAGIRRYFTEITEENFPDLSDRIQNLRDKQLNLECRADTILQRLMYQNDPIAGEFELQYHDSLEKINIAIKGRNGLRIKIKQLQERHEALRQDYQLLSPRRSFRQSKQFVVLSGSQLNKVEDALNKEMDLINDTTRKIEETQEKLKRVCGAKSKA